MKTETKKEKPLSYMDWLIREHSPSSDGCTSGTLNHPFYQSLAEYYQYDWGEYGDYLMYRSSFSSVSFNAKYFLKGCVQQLKKGGVFHYEHESESSSSVSDELPF